MNKRIVLMGLMLGLSQLYAQVTKVGNDTLLDVGSWNVEWWGDATNGPSNEPLQYTNVKSVLVQTEIDVWGLSEVSSVSVFNNLLMDAPIFDGFLSTYSQTQKTGLIWNQQKLELLSAQNVLTESTYYYAFASGRPPLEVVLRTINTPISDTITFYVVHLKANSGNGDQSSYDRRKNAVAFLKSYLETYKAGQKIVVLGDWNDDVDQSVVEISSAYLPTPFGNFVADSAKYFFPTRALSLAGERSYVSYPNMIDHQLISRQLKDSFYMAGSAMVMKPTALQISGYSNNTSDHYPILSRYNLNRPVIVVPPVDTPNTGLSTEPSIKVSCYPNPANHKLIIDIDAQVASVEIYNLTGARILLSSETIVDVSDIPDGMYVVHIKTKSGASKQQKITIQHGLAN